MVHNKIRCVLIACVVSLLALPVSLGNNGAGKSVHVGVRVNIPEILYSAPQWSDRTLQIVRDGARDKLLTVVSDNFIHWDFYDCGDDNPPVLLTLDIVEERTNQLVVKLQARIRKEAKPGSTGVAYKPFVLAKDKWYEPGDMTSGPPGPTKTREKLNEFIRLTFPADEDDRTIPLNVERLFENVPLARAPKWIEPRKNKFILPLSKARYSHLLWSRFWLRPRKGSPDQARVEARADDDWDSYDQTITEALIADIEKDSPPCDPNVYEPAFVYLLEYKEDVGLDVYSGDDQ